MMEAGAAPSPEARLSEASLAVRPGQVVIFPKTPPSRPPESLATLSPIQAGTHDAIGLTTQAAEQRGLVPPALQAQLITQHDQRSGLTIEPYRQTASLYARQQNPTPTLSALDIRI